MCTCFEAAIRHRPAIRHLSPGDVLIQVRYASRFLVLHSNLLYRHTLGDATTLALAQVVDISVGTSVPAISNFRALPTPGNAIWPQILLDIEYQGARATKPCRCCASGNTAGPRLAATNDPIEEAIMTARFGMSPGCLLHLF